MFLYSKIWSIFNKELKSKFSYLFFLIFLGTILETLSIGLVIPLAYVITDPTSGNFLLLKNFIKIFNISENLILIFFVGIFFLVFFLKIIILVYISAKQNKLTYELQSFLAYKIFSNYLKKEYLFHLNNNSSKLIRNITSEVNVFSTNVLIASLTLTLELMVTFSILIFLLFFKPLGAVIIFFLFGICGLIFFIFLKKKIYNLGITRQNLANDNLQNLMNGFQGIKEIKFLNMEINFLNYFKNGILKVSNINYLYSTIMSLPRFFLEFLTIISVCFLILFLKYQNESDAFVVSTVALFGAAAFRVLPSATRVMGAIQNIRYGKPTLDLLKRELESTDKINSNDENLLKSINLDFNNEIIIKDLNFSFDKKNNILCNINLVINKRDKIGIIGPTGSGKSTFIDLFVGLLSPNSGDIQLGEMSIYKNLKLWQSKIAYVSQSVFLLDDTFFNNINFGLKKKMNETEINKILEKVDLYEFVKNLPEGLNTRVGERGSRISGGQKQRIGIARALCRDVEILILDESTSSLDLLTENLIMKEIKKIFSEKIIITISHRRSALVDCNKILLINKGTLTREN